METSNTISKIAIAVSKMQGQLTEAKKSGKNSHFKNGYAMLEDCWAVCRKPLSDNELALIQAPSFVDGRMVLVTQLIHSSGEWFQSCLSLKPERGDNPQAIGSAITYAKRYSLMSMLGLSDSDDDGNAASAPKVKIILFDVTGYIDTSREDHVHFCRSYFLKNDIDDDGIKRGIIQKAIKGKIKLIDLNDFIKKTLIEMEQPNE